MNENVLIRSWKNKLKKYSQVKSILSIFLTSRKFTKSNLFITGVPRSGTTLLKNIITTHPNFGSCSYEGTSLLSPPRDIEGWSRDEISNSKFKSILEKEDNIVDIYENVAKYILRDVEGKIFVDKIWPSKIRTYYVRKKFPNYKWIHIVRDPKDSYCSAKKHGDIPQSHNPKKMDKVLEKVDKNLRKYNG